MNINYEMKAEIIKESVERLEKDDWKEYGVEKKKGPQAYDDCVKKVKTADLSKAQNLEETFNDFLIVWGNMRRVLDAGARSQEKEFNDWESKVVEKVKAYSHKLEELRTKDLLGEDLNEHQGTIIELYNALLQDDDAPFKGKKKKSPIAAVKTLHLICPGFFPLWDNPIAAGVRAEQGKKKKKRFSAEDYYKFMMDLQSLGKKYERVLLELVPECNKTKVKILDMFLLWTVRRPFSFFLPTRE